MSKEMFPPFTDPFEIDDIDYEYKIDDIDYEYEIQIAAGAIEANFARKAVDGESDRLMRGLTKERDDWRKWRQPGSKNKSLINGVRRLLLQKLKPSNLKNARYAKLSLSPKTHFKKFVRLNVRLI